MILKVCGLSFMYSSIPVLRDVSFGLKEGEILSILGPNGAGKTTLLKSLNRILIPQDGTVMIDGYDICNLRQGEIAKKIGWVPQQGEMSRMKVYDLILLGRKPYFRWGPGRADHAKVEEAISLMDIESLSMRYADEISGGEFQLVQIVRALAQSPRVIFFDEPTNSLDISNQHNLMSKISSLIHSGTMAAVMTMHDINLALRYSDKFLMLKNGSVQASGGRSIVNPETIKAVYNMDAQVVEAGGYPIVVPV